MGTHCCQDARGFDRSTITRYPEIPLLEISRFQGGHYMSWSVFNTFGNARCWDFKLVETYQFHVRVESGSLSQVEENCHCPVQTQR